MEAGVTAALVAAVAALVLAPAGLVKRGDVRVAGTCTASSTAKLKLSEEDGRIEVELEVDQNRIGVRWVVTIAQSGMRIARLTRVTKGPSGSFTARVVAPNGPGVDRLVVRATSPSGELCTARAGF